VVLTPVVAVTPVTAPVVTVAPATAATVGMGVAAGMGFAWLLPFPAANDALAVATLRATAAPNAKYRFMPPSFPYLTDVSMPPTGWQHIPYQVGPKFMRNLSAGNCHVRFARYVEGESGFRSRDKP
jgi:hypothetical protein